MRILISNDDGIFAPGLAALVHAFAAAGAHGLCRCTGQPALGGQPQHDAVSAVDGEEKRRGGRV